ncbi:hypothetical protein PBY51_018486 [Eleginops maclovinus]|uniref:Uncharacterized protein n=1 Tax=Eleginops maclovinus TaxID=56733 RepID=A0AAN8ASE2_ELEMC|nr:hypothetical protein PBY51_018486 [Eleginops maclovinus]
MFRLTNNLLYLHPPRPPCPVWTVWSWTWTDCLSTPPPAAGPPLLETAPPPPISLEPLTPPHPSAQRPSDITIAVTSGGSFFTRTSMSPLVCEMELPDLQNSVDLYNDNKS